jgi:3-isopropylmalate/(R)-2-methylmalate dehydratase small subunit
MQPFVTVTGTVAPLDRPNVDTDAIIPKQYLKSIKRTGFGPNAFDDWRYLDAGGLDVDNASRRPNPDFVLNQPACREAKILLARENFGCGSSREHAVWALDDFGFRAVLAPSFADIFFGNCFKNGLLPIVLPTAAIDRLFALTAAQAPLRLTVDLPAQTVSGGGEQWPFEIDAERKRRLLAGLDDIALTLQQAEQIRAYEARRRNEAPWLFADLA